LHDSGLFWVLGVEFAGIRQILPTRLFWQRGVCTSTSAELLIAVSLDENMSLRYSENGAPCAGFWQALNVASYTLLVILSRVSTPSCVYSELRLFIAS
jgi:hypothetical protein